MNGRDDDDGRTATGTEDSPAAEPEVEAGEASADDEERGIEAAPQEPDPVEELRAQVQQLEDQLLRRRAEFENFRRRAERERGQAGEEAVGELLKQLLPIFDNLERAARAEGDEGSVRAGVELILRSLSSVLDARGVVTEDPAGQPFDPARHQALAHEPVEGAADGTIVEVFQKGYLLGDRLLRPALVGVAKGADEDSAEETEEKTEDGGETLH